ncbi:MAG TPA: RNA polymerase sigma factor [Silvibacterium sp.]|nr:RNA polymerase sigma factor [Silvibacterium sp.]
MDSTLAATGAARLVSSEVAEFEALVARQSQFVFRVAHAILRNSHDAEDAVQETFLKLYRNKAWKSIADERAFLARTAWRVAVDRLSKPRPADSDPVSELASGAPDPEQRAIAANQHAAIHRMIDSLPEELRQPLVLAAIDELNSREIALILGIPEGTVRTRTMRARQMLKQKLATSLEKLYAR